MASNNNGERSGNSAAATTATVTARRGKNKTSNTTNTNSEKPKQPQRGLGVAQLEKIRLHTQMVNRGLLSHHQVPSHHLPGFMQPSFQHVPEYQFEFQVPAPPQHPPTPQFRHSSPQASSSSYGYHHPDAFMIGMRDQTERYSESQLINTARWNPSNNFRATPETQPYPFPSGMITRHLLSHVEQQNGRSNLYESKSSSSQNFDSNRKEEVDLELKL